MTTATFIKRPGRLRRLRIPAMTDSCSGDDGHHRSEATQAGGLLYRLSAMVPRGIGLAH